MPIYYYKAIMHDGQMETGTIEQPGRQEVLAWLETNNAIPVTINEKPQRLWQDINLKSFTSFSVARQKLPLADLTNSIAMLLRAGLSLDRALKSVAMASDDTRVKTFLLEIENEIREGHSFSTALEKYRNDVGDLYISMVRAGEVSGKLDEAMAQLAQHLEQARALKENIITAMMYPMVLLTVTLLSIILLMVLVMPRFKQLFDDMGGEIPAITQLFISLSDLMSQHGMLGLFILLLLLLGFNTLKKKQNFTIWLDQHILRLPWYGALVEKLQMTRFALTLSVLLKNGVAIQQSIALGRGVLSNRFIEADIREREQLLSEGKSFSETVGQCFPKLTRQMIQIGEEAGELESTLDYVAGIAREDVDRAIKRVLSIIEPLIIVVLGLVVAAVIGSIMVAVLSMNDLVVM